MGDGKWEMGNENNERGEGEKEMSLGARNEMRFGGMRMGDEEKFGEGGLRKDGDGKSYGECLSVASVYPK